MTANSEKEHLSIVICGHVDSGKSTTTGRLIFELGGLPERELEKLKQEAERLGKGSFAFAFYMDRQKEERERGVTIACTTKEHGDSGHGAVQYCTCVPVLRHSLLGPIAIKKKGPIAITKKRGFGFVSSEIWPMYLAN